MKNLTTIQPDDLELAARTRRIAATVTCPDGVYEVEQFREGITVDVDLTFFWSVRRQNDALYYECLTTSLEAAMEWLGRRITETCF